MRIVWIVVHSLPLRGVVANNHHSFLLDVETAQQRRGRVSGQDGGNVREFARHLYSSKAWKKCRASYLRSVGGLCERCLQKGMYKPAVIVHHKEWLNPENINDPTVTMNFDNLEALCRECHEEEHAEGNKLAKHRKRRYVVGKDGKVTALKGEI